MARIVTPALLRRVDEIRGIPGDGGLRPYDATIRVRTWSGPIIGQGTKADVDSPLRVANGTARVKVRQLNGRDVIASGGVFTDQDYELGPLTPPYPGSADNSALAIAHPDTTGNVELFFRLVGPEIPSGAWFRRVGQRSTSALHYTAILRKTDEMY